MANKKKKTEQEYRMFFGFVPLRASRPLIFRLRGISSLFTRFFDGLEPALRKIGVPLSAPDYLSFGVINYTWIVILLAVLLGFVAFHSNNPLLSGNVRGSIAIGIGGIAMIFLGMLLLLGMMPRIHAKSVAKDTDKMLLYALKDLLLQVNAGNTLFAAMVAVANSSYGDASKLFSSIVQQINVGIPMKQVLEDHIRTTDSEYVKRALWQMVSSLRAGADLKRTLGGVIEELNNDQKNQIMSYARELNLWSLFYMLFAVAIPTIGSTMLVILSTFAGFGISSGTFVAFIIICFFVQIAMVMFVRTRRPVVQF